MTKSTLLIVLFIKAIVMAVVILFGGIGLGPDEAQYWTWSQQLDFGYYSKPPAIAWLIKLGTLLFGNTELGVRSGSLLLGTLIPIGLYHTAKACRFQEETAVWAGLIMALTPLGIMSTLFAITDVGMILCWTLALYMVCHAFYQKKPLPYEWIGVTIAVGALFKWPIYVFWFIPLIAMFYEPAARSWRFLTGAALSLLGLLPSLFWNYNHDWVTFRHVFSTLKATAPQEASKGNFIEFLGAQAGLLTPIFFVLLIFGFFHFFRHREKKVALLALSALLPLFIASGLSLFKKILGNWVVFAYPSAIIFLAWYLSEKVSWGKLWLKIGILFSILIGAIILFTPLKNHVFKHNVGWDRLAPALTQAGYQPGTDFLFGDKYQSTSLLSFYGPAQKRGYFLNINGTRHNQFSFWPGMAEEQIGKTGYFVVTENMPRAEKIDPEQIIGQLRPYFQSVEYLGNAPLTPSKKAFIFRGKDYNGIKPVEPSLY